MVVNDTTQIDVVKMFVKSVTLVKGFGGLVVFQRFDDVHVDSDFSAFVGFLSNYSRGAILFVCED